MNPTTLFKLLADYQQKVLELCEEHPEDFNIQYHPDLSPLGWHLGHCVYTETYWIREQLLGVSSPDQKLKAHYVPELANKSDRGEDLPDYSELCQWAKERQQENLELLIKYQNKKYENRKYQDANDHPLMQHDFIFHFLIQHYAQHFEIMHMILVQKTLQECDEFEVRQPLSSSELNISTALLEGGLYSIGSQTDFLPYDNEYPCHEFKTDDINIANKPVSNSEFLLFMEQSAYQNPDYWSQEGWHWKEKFDVSCPEFWMRDKQQNWFGIDIKGPHHLDSDHPVWGINYYEAQAFANWAGCRLPHEYEWEAASQNGCLKNTGLVWEWCQNSFHPYANFKAFPYAGYSMPYFDGSHFVMKGASRYTEDVIHRSSFRNYYQADKRHQFSGCRLVIG